MALDVYAAYFLACLVIVIVPGPTVTLIVANSLRHGVRAGILNMLGTQVGEAIIIAAAGVGLASLIEALGYWFDWLRLAGAAYLIWLGWKLIRSSGEVGGASLPRAPRGGFIMQGCAVALSNPKTLLFFGAFFPQFIDSSRDYVVQIALMGATAMVVSAISDSCYALASGRAGREISPRRVRLLSRISGGFLIGGGVWLAAARR